MNETIWEGTLKDLQPVKSLPKPDDCDFSVFIVTRVSFGGLYRLKVIPRSSRNKEDVTREFEVMSLLLKNGHSGFSHCYDMKEDDRYFYLLCSHTKGHPLREVVSQNFPLLSRHQVLLFTLNLIVTVSERVSVLHSLGFCHDLLTLDNLVMDENKTPVLVDFEHVKQYRYRKLPQNFGDKFVLSFQDKRKCLCYQHIGELAHSLITFSGSEVDHLEVSDFIGKLKCGKIGDHTAVLKHPCVEEAKLDLKSESGLEKLIKTTVAQMKICPKISDRDTVDSQIT